MSPGDLIAADQDGAIVVPSRHIEAVAERAAGLERKQAVVRRWLLAGGTRAAIYADRDADQPSPGALL
jgi:regulator of RNase E activity RraA